MAHNDQFGLIAPNSLLIQEECRQRFVGEYKKLLRAREKGDEKTTVETVNSLLSLIFVGGLSRLEIRQLSKQARTEHRKEEWN